MHYKIVICGSFFHTSCFGFSRKSCQQDSRSLWTLAVQRQAWGCKVLGRGTHPFCQVRGTLMQKIWGFVKFWKPKVCSQSRLQRNNTMQMIVINKSLNNTEQWQCAGKEIEWSPYHPQKTLHETKQKQLYTNLASNHRHLLLKQPRPSVLEWHGKQKAQTERGRGLSGELWLEKWPTLPCQH